MNKNVTGYNHATKTPLTVEVGQNVKWRQRGLNRWIEGELVDIIETELSILNTNETQLKVKVASGKIVSTRLWQLF
jgi:hypothetical protein